MEVYVDRPCASLGQKHTHACKHESLTHALALCLFLIPSLSVLWCLFPSLVHARPALSYALSFAAFKMSSLFTIPFRLTDSQICTCKCRLNSTRNVSLQVIAPQQCCRGWCLPGYNPIDYASPVMAVCLRCRRLLALGVCVCMRKYEEWEKRRRRQ